MTISDAIDTYLVCRSNKRRSSDSIMYEIHYERNLVRLCAAVNDRSLQPTAYVFITMHPRPALVEKFLCTMNSYTGLFRNVDEYGTLRRLADAVSERWYRYVELDGRRMCLVAKAEYRHKELLAMRYGLKINKISRKKRNDKRGNQRTGAQAA